MASKPDDLQVDAGEIEWGAKIGKGAFGQVRAARYRGAEVAVKRVPPVLDELAASE